ncbi:twin-arginine translocase TatA/TatE family subunit [Hymenobacter chitinivorans]|uniref:Sec-independent protein translocase protein TatA n=1 Tax=Hymenobacter chitinivorans DSM 11115 TaxID=1121954 RepID=A0A2M9B9A0_9BACT|nr:twin-arginine translocase TatA/TatE family subunit [Hymenobacter chitinivorans]PJJ54511.1 sec-independent protein translocase protein TatA [Hymenobacter chitinivorans DSM 11115]
MQTPTFLFLGDLGGGEIMLIMVVILIFFGANKIPELARGLGKGIREFKDASREIRSEFENADQPRHNPNAGYQAPPVYPAPAAAEQPTTPVHPNAADNANVAYSAPATPVAPPMDGGITPPVPTPEERPRLDQMTN